MNPDASIEPGIADAEAFTDALQIGAIRDPAYQPVADIGQKQKIRQQVI
jgi:hypothetical protein